ncbi:MAG: DNA polymerase [Patescibacteria group bacterium]
MRSGTKTSRETLVLLDTHAIIHRAYHALPPLTDTTGAPVGAVYGLSAMLIRLIKELKPDYLVAAYDLPGPTHRHEAYKEYKATRKKIDDDLVLQIERSRDVLAAFGIPILEAPGFEADDIIGTIATKEKKDYNIIIASGDMDTLQLVDDTRVRVYTLKKGINDTVIYDEAKVVERYGFPPHAVIDYKGLAGDSSDNIIGIPGIGEKTATELIQKYGGVSGIYAALKKNKNALVEGGIKPRVQKLVVDHEDEAEFSKVLATIRVDAPVEFAAHKVSDVLNIDSVKTLFHELGFRSLVARVDELSGGTAHKKVAQSSDEVPAPTRTDSQLFKRCAVMTWLLNSSVQNPGLDDILARAKVKTLEEAERPLMHQLTQEHLDSVYKNIEEPLIPVVDAMIARGVLIDTGYLAGLSKEYHKAINAVAKKIYKYAGEEFNINSPKQLGDILFAKLGLAGARQKKTAGGQLSTKESELIKLEDAHPIIPLILEHRELAKLLGTYIDAIPPLVDAAHRLHSTFSQTGSATGRMSSRDPGIQNIPTQTERGARIRGAFVAPRGSALLSLDYSQIELRLAAILSGDEKLTDIFVRGLDVHTAVAAQVFNVPPEKVSKEERRRAKVINFGILYGMGVNALKDNLGTDRAEAQDFYNKYFETFSTLAQYLEKTRQTATRLGYTTTFYGRKRYFPELKSPLPFIRASGERMAINAPIQGTQADIIKIAMVRAHALIEKEYASHASLIMQIHDELMFEIKKELVAELAPKIKKIMESVLTRAETNGIPITVSTNAGQSWDDLKAL